MDKIWSHITRHSLFIIRISPGRDTKRSKIPSVEIKPRSFSLSNTLTFHPYKHDCISTVHVNWTIFFPFSKYFLKAKRSQWLILKSLKSSKKIVVENIERGLPYRKKTVNERVFLSEKSFKSFNCRGWKTIPSHFTSSKIFLRQY